MKKRIGAFVNAYYHYSIQEALAGIAGAGFTQVELLSTPGLAKGMLPDPDQITQTDIESYRALCRKYDLAINGIYYYKGGSDLFNLENGVDKLTKIVDIAVLCGSPFIITDTDEVDSDDREKEFYQYIRQVCDYAGSHGVMVCLDIHGSWCRSGKRAAEIMKTANHPQLGINYCAGNVIYYEGVRPEEDIRYALPYLKRVHIKDSSGTYREYDFPVPGEGSIDFSKIFDSLKGFRGPMNAELDFGKEQIPLNEINRAFKKSYDYLKSLGLDV